MVCHIKYFQLSVVCHIQISSTVWSALKFFGCVDCAIILVVWIMASVILGCMVGGLGGFGGLDKEGFGGLGGLDAWRPGGLGGSEA